MKSMFETPFDKTPSIDRVFRAVMATEPWSEEELLRRDDNPEWLVTEAEAYAQLASFESDLDTKMKLVCRAHELVRKVGDAELERKVIELLDIYQSKGVAASTNGIHEDSPTTTLASSGKTIWNARSIVVVVGAASLLGFLAVISFALRSNPILQPTTILAKATIEDVDQFRADPSSQSVYCFDKMDYNVSIETSLEQAWLLRMSDPTFPINVSTARAVGRSISIEASIEFDARDAIEYFLTIVANRGAIGETDDSKAWLIDLSDELKTIIPSSDPNNIVAKQCVLKHVRQSGYIGPVEICIDRYMHHRETRL